MISLDYDYFLAFRQKKINQLENFPPFLCGDGA